MIKFCLDRGISPGIVTRWVDDRASAKSAWRVEDIFDGVDIVLVDAADRINDRLERFFA